MKALQRVVMTMALVGLLVGSASATTGLPEERQPLPGAALVSMFGNVLYVPVRLGVTVATAWVGGITGFLTGGSTSNAEDVWGVTDGQAILTRDAVQGIDPVRFGDYQYRLELITPGY